MGCSHVIGVMANVFGDYVAELTGDPGVSLLVAVESIHAIEPFLTHAALELLGFLD